MTRSTLRLALLLLLPAPFVAAPAAADLGPRRASEVVHGFASGADCPLGIAGEAFDMRLLPEGGTAPLAIPARRVLVVRRVELGTSGGTPGTSLTVSFLGGSSGTASSYAVRTVVLDASGVGREVIEFPLGVVIPAGGSACVSNTGGADFGGFIEGYFAPAK